jgi:hypothetical protein
VSDIVIEKGGQVMATAGNCEAVEILGEDAWEGICLIKCYFFGRVRMAPPILFEHLSGASLGNFLNGSSLSIDGEAVASGLKYVHGRSEVMRGTPTISSVLLARPEPEGGVTDMAWLSYLPGIYKKFLSNRGRSAKSA